MSLHRVDPRFVLPHPVRRAVVLGGLEEWRAGLESAGVEVVGESALAGAPDLVVSPSRLAGAAGRAGARSVVVEGSRERPLGAAGYRTRRLLLRPTRERPTLGLPLDQRSPVTYALDWWSVVDRRWKRARLQAARALVPRGLVPSWASPLVTAASTVAGPPALVAAAADFGVPGDAGWFLTFGQGDALSRNGFQLFRAGSRRPEWILKFARVPGYSERFDNDERGLRLARGAGAAVAEHAPRLVGRFELDGLHASLETAAAGRRLRDVLLAPGGRAAKLELIERIGGWILELGRMTRTSAEAMGAERDRLRTEVVPSWSELGAGPGLVDRLPPLQAVAQHNDLGTWNVVAGEEGFLVVDWENVRQAALPLWDLLYFLGDAFVLLDGPPATPEELPGRMARLFAGESQASSRLFSWVRRAAEAEDVPPESVGTIATLCWLSHSLSARAHNLDLATFTPGDPPRMHGLEGMAHAWMAHPALGPGWDVWRA